MVASILETNIDEAKQFLSHVGVLPWIIFGFVVIFLWCLTRKTSKTGLMGIFVLVMLLVFPVAKVAIPSWLNIHSRAAYDFRKFPVEMLRVKYRAYLLMKEPAMIAQYYSVKSTFETAANMQRKMPEGLSYQNEHAGAEKIILILGESVNKHHLGIYGYEYPTDEFLMEQKKKKTNIAIFNAIFPAPITRESVVRILSFASIHDLKPFMEDFGFLDVAKKAGYETVWLSNQSGVGIHDSLIKLIAIQANKNVSVHGQDDELLNPLKAELKKEKKQFIVLHLRGSHLGYEHGHDALDYDRAQRSNPENRHYDATISHTDRLLKSVTDLTNKYPKSLLVYVSDHGEIVNVGHGSPKLDIRQYDIPLVAWSQDRLLLDQFNRSVQRYSMKNPQLFNTVSLPYVLSELIGYRINENIRKQSIEESKYIFNVDGVVYPIERLK